jgi:hypothetical protein
VEVTGRIIAVQEQRFRLLTDTGQVYLLTLGGQAGANADTLAHFQHDRTHLAVRFSGQPNLAGGVALQVREDGRT